ncbi:MAG: flagellar biosynthetic protein FliR [Oligoflexales bacterium]
MVAISVAEILKGTLIFFRIGAAFTTLPFFGDQPTPVPLRILLTIAVSFCINLIVPATWFAVPLNDIVMFFVVVVKEILVGLVIGFLAKLLIDGLIMSSSLVGYQMGFGTASLLMPGADEQMNSFTALHRIVILTIFLSLDLHHLFLAAVIETFKYIPAGAATLSAASMDTIVSLSSRMFLTGMKLAAPILVALMFAMSAMGLIARTVPQMNVFTMSFPLSFFIGIVVYAATLPFFPSWIQGYFDNHAPDIFNVVRSLTKG